MRKAAILLAVLLVLSVGGVCVAASGVYEAHDRVALTETVVYGDRAAADGLTVVRRTGYNDHLLWDTVCTLDAGQTTETDYAFSASGVNETGPATYNGVYLQTDSSTGMSFDPDFTETPTGLEVAYQELYNTVGPGEEKSAVIYLKDYLDYYPVYVELDFPGTLCSMDGNEVLDLVPEPGTQLYAMAKLRDYFKVPVLEDERRNISVRKNINGKIRSRGSGTVGDFFSMQTYSVLTGDACYFTFDAHNSGGQVVDTGEIPDGYGIYRLPYEEDRRDESGQKVCGVDVDALEMVYSLNPEIDLLGLSVNEEQTRLLLYAVEDGAYVLTVIDLETMDTLQKLKIADRPENSGWGLYDGGDFMVAQLSGKRAVISVTDSGDYALQFVCDVTPDGGPTFWYQDAAWDFDGERLAYVETLEKVKEMWGWTQESCGFRLAVYDASGLLYCGEYRSSLNTGEERGSSYYENGNYDCLGRGRDPVAVRWQE